MAQHVRLKKFEMNFEGIARCAVGPELHRAVKTAGEAAKVFAESIAPSYSTEYRRSFELDVKIIPDIPYRVKPNPPMARWAAELANVSDHALIVEVGAKATPEYRVMRRTLEWLSLVAE